MQILDVHGCLTAEAMCFNEELGPDQRAVVDRHVRSCALCAHQQAGLARAAQRVRRGRPRVTVPGDARVAAHRAILRSLTLQRNRLRVQQLPVEEAPPQRGWLWLGVTIAAFVALISSIAALVWL